MSAAVPEEGDRGTRRRNRNIRQKIVNYSDIARPIMATVPYVGGGLVEASRALEKRLQKPWNIAFAELAADLRALETPILVVVDDIDRLQPHELLDLLKIVRLLGRFPGVDFLLAYDERTIVDTLQDPHRGTVTKARARSFMEKIVQYPLSMPPLLTGKIVKMLDEGITETLTLERVEESFEKHRFRDIILTIMPSQLGTPRAIGRFLAQVREQFRIHDLEEMNDTDLILATLLRVQFPDLFAELQRWKPQLTGTRRSWLVPTLSEEEPNWEKLLKKVEDEDDRADARKVLEALFPAVQSKEGGQVSARRFAHPDYFNRYLAQTIPADDMPDATITRALEAAAGGDASQLRTLLFADDDERVTLALSKIRARYPDPTTQYDEFRAGRGPVTPELIASGMGLADELRERMDAWTDELSLTIYWIANVARISVTEDPTVDLAAPFAACTRLDRRSYAVHAALSDIERLSEPAQQALRELHRQVAELVLPELIEDLRRGDESDGRFTGSFLYNFVLETDLKEDLRAAVRAGLTAGEFRVEDVAARFVGFAYVIGGSGKPSSASFSGEVFTAVTGIPATSTDHNERGDWSDPTWARKREFALEYVNDDHLRNGGVGDEPPTG